MCEGYESDQRENVRATSGSASVDAFEVRRKSADSEVSHVPYSARTSFMPNTNVSIFHTDEGRHSISSDECGTESESCDNLFMNSRYTSAPSQTGSSWPSEGEIDEEQLTETDGSIAEKNSERNKYVDEEVLEKVLAFDDLSSVEIETAEIPTKPCEERKEFKFSAGISRPTEHMKLGEGPFDARSGNNEEEWPVFQHVGENFVFGAQDVSQEEHLTRGKAAEMAGFSFESNYSAGNMVSPDVEQQEVEPIQFGPGDIDSLGHSKSFQSTGTTKELSEEEHITAGEAEGPKAFRFLSNDGVGDMLPPRSEQQQKKPILFLSRGKGSNERSESLQSSEMTNVSEEEGATGGTTAAKSFMFESSDMGDLHSPDAERREKTNKAVWVAR